MNLLTLNPYNVNGMKDSVATCTGRRTGEKGQMLVTNGDAGSWDGLCLANNGEQIWAAAAAVEGGPEKPRHKTHFVAIVFAQAS